MKSRLSLLMHMHTMRKHIRILPYIALGTVLLTAFQNCGEFRSTAVLNGQSQMSSSLEDADIQFGKTEILLKESDAAPFDVLVITAKPGKTARITYELMQLDDSGQRVNATVIGSFSGSATLNDAFPESEIRIYAGSQQIIQAAKSKVIFLLVTKEEPTAATYTVPVRILAAAGTPGTGGGVTPVPTPLPPNPPAPTPTPETPRVITPANATQTERQDECAKYVTNAPSFQNNFNDTPLTLGHGLSAAAADGQAIEGSRATASITANISRNVANLAKFNEWLCGSNQILNYQIVADVVTGAADNNGRAAPTFTNALQQSGAPRSLTTADLRTELARDLFTMGGGANNNNQLTLEYGTDAASFPFNPRYTSGTRTQKCVAGTVWLRIRVRQTFPGRNGNGQIPDRFSAPQYVNLNVVNNCWTEHRLRKAGNANYDSQIKVGTKVAISGDWAAALAENDFIDEARQNVGAVYMFKKEGSSWVQKGSKVTVAELSSNQNIRAVAIKGDVMVVGVPTRNRGVAYVFRRSGDVWNLAETLTPAATDGAAPHFGFSIAMNSTHIAIGTPYANKVYFYPYTSTTLSAATTVNQMTSLMIAGEDRSDFLIQQSFFGGAIALTESQLVVGAPLESGRPFEVPGMVHVYSFSAGAATHVKSFAGTQSTDGFGFNVAVSGARLAIASRYFKNNDGVSLGRVDYYSDYTANPATVTRSWNGAFENSKIGEGLAFTAQGLYIGNPVSANINPPGQTFYYAFARDAGGAFNYGSFANLFRLRAYNEEAADSPARFGGAIATDGTNVIIGAANKRDGVGDGGAAFIFEQR